MADINHGIAGGLAGITVDLVFYPLETIKTRIMASTPGENLRSLVLSKFRGFSCQMIVSFPYSFSFFAVYESIRHYSNKTVVENAFASICAEIVANVVRNPFEIMKQQLMVGRSEKILESLQQIYKNKGLRGFYIGYKPTLIRDIVFSGVQLPLFEKIRRKFMEYGYSSVVSASAGGFMAAIVSGFLSCPLDVIRTRLMTQKMDSTHSSVTR
jgi:solute carrier family 25 S-adenosylmethionine transporter 26